jgi:hypothetical protein
MCLSAMPRWGVRSLSVDRSRYERRKPCLCPFGTASARRPLAFRKPIEASKTTPVALTAWIRRSGYGTGPSTEHDRICLSGRPPIQVTTVNLRIPEMSGFLLSHQKCRVTGALLLGIAEPRGVAVSRSCLRP